MPSFWTSDVPLVQIQVQIVLDTQSAYSGRALVVPSAVHNKLQHSIARRCALVGQPLDSVSNVDEHYYASIQAGQAGTKATCVVYVVHSDSLDNEESSKGVYICKVTSAAWSAITESDACSNKSNGCTQGTAYINLTEELSIDATLEAIAPLDLTEIVFGVTDDQYGDALKAQGSIADYIRSSTRIYYQGLEIAIQATTETSASQNSGGMISLTCLMCQPVIQGVVRKGSNPRIIITKSTGVTKQNALVPDTRYSEYRSDNGGDIGDDEQWNLGVEWFIIGDIPLGSNRNKIAGAAFNDPVLIGQTGESCTDKLSRINPLSIAAPHNCKYSTSFDVVGLKEPVDDSQILPTPVAGDDVYNRGYMPLAALARAGIVSGSWVLVEPEHKPSAQLLEKQNDYCDAICPLSGSYESDRARQRAIRIFALDSMASCNALALPPLLLYNIFAVGGQKPLAAVQICGSSSNPRVLLTPIGMPPDSPSLAYLENTQALAQMGNHLHQPPLPVAKKVYIARVSSPLSERRDLELHALDALEKWLSPSAPNVGDGNKALRVVKTGDLIAVRISIADAVLRTSVALVAGADVATRLRNGDHTIEPDSVDINPVTDLALDHSISNSENLCVNARVSENELVFYKVVKAEGFKRTPDICSLPYSISSITSSKTAYENGDSDNDDDRSADSESEYSDIDDGGYIASNSSKPTDLEDALSRNWATWYRQVYSKGFVILPQVTMVVQAGAAHSHVPYQAVRGFELAKTTPNRRIRLDVNGGDTASISVAPYANVQAQLARLANASLHPLALSHKLVSAVLLKGNPGTGKRHIVRSVADRLGVHIYELSCFDILSDTEDKTAQVLQMYFQNVGRYTPCIFHLRNIEALAQATHAPPGQDNSDDLPIARVFSACIADMNRTHRETGFPIIVIATSNQPDKLPTSLAAAFRHEIELPVPDEQTRLMLLTSITSNSLPLAPDANIAYVAQQTASFVARDLAMLIKRAEGRAWKRVHNKMAEQATSCASAVNSVALRVRDLFLSGQTITNDDLLGALSDARASMSDTLGVPKIPNVKWEDVGGLADAKKDILDTIRLPMEQPHLFSSGLNTRSGLLFYGPPGTGKTLLAKAIATECGLNFFSCKGPELISPYIGESEANVRRIFQKAREASPCVIFFDELDSLAPKRGQQGDSGGVMDRIVSQLLAELDGMSSSSADNENKSDNKDDSSRQASGGGSTIQVFAIGATNRPDLLDPALLRPGRFDKLVYLGVSETHDAQLNIIQALTRKFHLHPDLDLHEIADQCPFNYTGADFYALCSDALLKAMLRTVNEVDVLVKEWNEGRQMGSFNGDAQDGNTLTRTHYPVPMTPQYYLDHIAEDSVKQVTVALSDFESALVELIPSVSADELERYQTLRHQFDSALKINRVSEQSDE
ncbi:peroxisomal assembly protein [Coemansia spiralis]|uniref:Peroxisomal ATPase PEX6 n=2 Tax=Coemansia TaxID=4863 RepID=A0A9W8GCC9_9FUNG|nr:peroxisomal assembly protein [Coemansia umbellata]KAJ2625865.1 peroxisomal assembly protein [Coemansia sp. RSA 1358]KAJ2680987.1 peroxisomal assembly protein [Coemansia spiralis]